ncbi:hypothetical protein OM945_03615 [Levilactobacillus namurensis]|nr:hypothetical protein [Levilactobacillus namurensis]
MTDAGFALETRVRADETKMQFTRATISTDDHFSDTDDALAKLTELSNIQQDGKVTAVQVINTTTVYVQVDVNQAESKADYQMRSAALYAKDDDGTEVLYGVTVLQDSVFVHKDADGSYLGFGINTTVGRASNVVVVVNPANMVTQQVFESTMKNYYTKAEVDAKFVTDDDFASKLPKNIATTDAANTFAKSQTLAGGATDGAGNAIATTEDVSDGDAETLKAAKAYADTQASDKISKNGRYGAENLVRNSAYMQNYNGWTAFGNGTVDDTKFSIFVTPHKFYHSDKDNLIQIVNLNTFTSGNASEVYLMSNSFSVTAGKTMAYSFLGFASANVVHEDVYFIGYKADGTQVPMILQQRINLSYNNLDGRSGTFTVPDDIITGQIRFDNNGSTNGKSAGLFITEVKVAEESVVSPWSPSRLDSVKDNGDDTVTINGKSYVPANAANVVHRNPDTGVVSEPVDFTKLTVNGGKSVATSDDLKSLEDASWRELNFDVSQGNYKAFSAAKIVYKINRDEKYISFFFAGTPSHVGSTSSKSTLVTDTISLVMDLSSVLTTISNINFQTNYGQISDNNSHAASLGYAGAKVVFTSQVYISNNLAGVTFLPQDYPDCRIYYTSLVNGI